MTHRIRGTLDTESEQQQVHRTREHWTENQRNNRCKGPDKKSTCRIKGTVDIRDQSNSSYTGSKKQLTYRIRGTVDIQDQRNS